MTATAHPLRFPAGRPSGYHPLADEPTFDEDQHLALEMLTERHITGTICRRMAAGAVGGDGQSQNP